MEPYIAPTRKHAKDTARRLVLDRSGSKLERAQSRFFTESVLKGECNCGQCEYIMCIFTPVRKPSQVAMVRWCRWCGRVEDSLPEEPPLAEELIEVTDDLIDVAPDLLQPTEEDIFQALERKLSKI